VTGQRAATGVAVVGMAGRFPGAGSVAQLWANVVAGRESLTRFDPRTLDAAGVSAADYRQPDYVPVRGVLPDIELFDADLFGYTPRDAEITDPQHRLLLECCWEALDAAGYGGRGGRVGVFAGTSLNTYFLRHLMARPDLERMLGLLPLVLANEKDHVATRVAYKLELAGPALTVQTACSTSLVAVHLACRSLLAGEADLALAGGSCVQLPQQAGYVFDPHGIVSPDGHCRAFDREARGTVPGNGVGVVVLKRLDEAVRDGDTIHAVIRGSAMNNDGGRKAGYTAPSVAGQADVVREALRAAGVPADRIGYVEAHGTGTELGDGVEIAALTEAFRSTTDRTGYCAVGSLKANIGHLDAAAGVAGFIKGVLAVRDGVLPPSINCDEVNPEIDWAVSPFYVNTRACPWTDRVRRCGVSSFGMGGTNVHVVLEQPPVPLRAASEGPASGGPALLVVSGRTAAAAEAVAGRLARHLAGDAAPALADVALTLQRGRVPLNWRAAVVARDPASAATALTASAPRKVGRSPSLVLMFPGQGAQHPGMASALYRKYPVFRETIDEGADALGSDIRDLLLAEPSDEQAAESLRRTRFAQPALFLVEAALFRLLATWGLRPRTLVGHSIGEVTAAYAASALAFHDALRLVTERARLVDGCATGSMLAVLAAEPDVADVLPADVSIAAVNAPQVVVISGPHAAVDRVESDLGDRGIVTKRLHVSHAFHSAMMEPIVDDLRRSAAAIPFHSPRTPVIGNVTGDYVSRFDAGYWAEQVRRPVRFSAGIRRALALPDPVFVEVGPGHTLTALVGQHDSDGAVVAVQTMAGPREDGAGEDGDFLLSAVGELWCAGVAVDLAAVNPAVGAGRVPLPSYPFQQSRHWIDAPSTVVAAAQPVAVVDPAPAAAEPGQRLALDIDAELARMWTNLLGVSAVADDANFFELGGQSLLAVRLVSSVRRRIGVKLALSDVLSARTFGAQCDRVRRLLATTPKGTPR